MNIETLRKFCNSLPSATEDIKWGNDLCFSIGGKMFCVTSLSGPFSVSFKVTGDEFDTLSTTTGVIPAPYVARYKWILVTDADRFTDKQFEEYIGRSYEMVKGKLPKKVLAKLG